MDQIINSKVNNNEIFGSINNIFANIDNFATIQQIEELNNEKVSKNEMIFYLNEKPSIEDIENILKEKISQRDLDNKFEELNQNLEIFRKEISNKMNDYALNKDLMSIKGKFENLFNSNMVEIKNILDTKADKDNVYNSLKLKSDRNEINTILGNKLDKADLALILKGLSEKLSKEEFNLYKEKQDKINQNKIDLENNIIDNRNKKLYEDNINIMKDVKDINNDIQEIKKNINKRIDIINTDIERLLDNIKSKFETVNIAINNINKKKSDSELYKNLSNLIKNKLDTDKFDSFIKKVKTNLENNFLEITKNNNLKIEELIESKIANISSNFSNTLEKQNNTLNNYVNENKNEMAQYQIRVQGIINKMDEENKSEIKKIKDEFIEKIDEKLITDKFYNLTEDTKKNNYNVNQITPNNINNNFLLNSTGNENNFNNLSNYKQITDILDSKRSKNEKISIIDDDIHSKIEEIKNELKSNKNEFSSALNNQALINETLCNENKLGRWLWNSGKLKNNYNIIWDTQKINTSPDNFKLENDKSIILVNEGGFYEIFFGFYTNKRPKVQILVDNEVVISNSNKNNNNSNNQTCSNTIYSGFMKAKKNNFGNGGFRNITGLTIIDFIFLPNNAKLSVFYSGDSGKGFLGLKKL